MARKVKRQQTQLRKQQQASSIAGQAVAMLSSLRNLTLNWRPGMSASTMARRAKRAGSPSKRAPIDVTGKLNLRALASPKWCGAYSGKQDRCEASYLGRPDGQVNLCTYDAPKKKCAAGKKWAPASGKPQKPSAAAPSKRKRKASGKARDDEPKKSKRPPKKAGSKRARSFRPQSTFTGEKGTETSWAGV